MRAIGAALATLLLIGCSSTSSLPDFTASGYLADRGTVRIWRKNENNQPDRILTVYSPFERGQVETTDYDWQQGKLTAITRQIEGEHPETVTLRFDSHGNLNFMQRQRDNRREAVSEESVALLQFDAQRMLDLSQSLLMGRVFMTQGHWQADGAIKTCSGQVKQPVFDDPSRQLILNEQARSKTPVSVAWLDAPEGTQLILVQAQDVCANEPKEADF